MKEWKWSNGDIYEKSPRIFKQCSGETEVIKTQDYYNNIVVDNRGSALQQSLEMFDGITSLGNDQTPAFLYTPVELNKRESSYNKIADRDMFMQVGANPFLQNNNYVNDILVQDRFLKPVSTSMEKERREEKDYENSQGSTQYSANFE
uniref:Uncharacterized protein n=1 Tax=viral metagenome TaxID=1070528 RepID=A0A6C0F4X3_9ZZZZ